MQIFAVCGNMDAKARLGKISNMPLFMNFLGGEIYLKT